MFEQQMQRCNRCNEVQQTVGTTVHRVNNAGAGAIEAGDHSPIESNAKIDPTTSRDHS